VSWDCRDGVAELSIMYVYGFAGHLDSIDSEYGQIATLTVGTCYSILTASRATSSEVHFKHQDQGVAHANDSYYSCSRMLPNTSHVGAQQMPQQQCFYQNDRKHPKGTTGNSSLITHMIHCIHLGPCLEQDPACGLATHMGSTMKWGVLVLRG